LKQLNIHVIPEAGATIVIGAITGLFIRLVADIDQLRV
jgi:hypothetical protein